MKRNLLSLLAVGLWVVTACKDKDPQISDTEAPVITVSEPEPGSSFGAGDEIHFEALFEDNIALATYNINIHHNADGHSHARVALAPFSLDKSFEISGTRQEVHQHIEIAADATAGPYHFIVKAIDQAGNATSFDDGSNQEIEIWITNTEMPVVTYRNSAGNVTDHIHGHAGERLNVRGEIRGIGSDLSKVKVSVGLLSGVHEHDHDHAHGRLSADEILFSKTFDVPGGTREIQLEQLLAQENLTLTSEYVAALKQKEETPFLILDVTDARGNIARYPLEIEL